jgi:UMF1 family MFS transporter
MTEPAADNPPPSCRRAWFAWCMYDWANSAFATVILAAVLPVYFVSLVPSGGVVLPGLDRPLTATGLWSFAVGVSMVLMALTAPALGTLADRAGRRRRWLKICCLTGAGATSLLVLAGPGRYLLAAGLFILANFCFAAGNIFYNAFLPALATGPDLDRLSARGFALGYIGGGLALLLVFLLIQLHAPLGLPDAASATRLGFLLTALWWALFAIPTFRHLREDMIPPPSGQIPSGFSALWRAWCEIRRYPDLLRFLLAFLCYNDGIQTIIAVAAIFARDELGLSTTSILACFLMIQFTAMPGALLFGRLARRWGARNAILLSLLLFLAVTGYAYAMRHAWQFWLLGLVVALILGGSQAISRSLYGSLLPEGKYAEFFSFYAVSGKFASILGPLSFAALALLTGSNRLAILGLGVFFLLGMGLLLTVDVQRGQRAAQKVSP